MFFFFFYFYLLFIGFAWQAALKKSGVDLELLTDPSIHDVFENGIKGGISMITTRFDRANQPEVPGYDPALPRKELIYLDAVNLYGAGMMRPLPTNGFRRLSAEERTTFDINTVERDGPKGYALVVDLQVPEHLHDVFADYPLAPEHLVVEESLLSETQLDMRQMIIRDALARKNRTDTFIGPLPHPK